MSSRFLVVSAALLATLGGLSTACGPTVPEKPTWDANIKPIFQAHCFRCHDGSRATAFVDKATAEALSKRINQSVHGTYTDPPPMPQAPAQILEDWQIETIENWARSL